MPMPYSPLAPSVTTYRATMRRYALRYIELARVGSELAAPTLEDAVLYRNLAHARSCAPSVASALWVAFSHTHANTASL